MKKNTTYAADVLVTALAPAIWGSTYFVTTEFLPQGYPFHVAMLRALPAGILLLLLVRKLPQGVWWPRSFVLGALNFSFFWAMLFVSAYRLPGGVAATGLAGAVSMAFGTVLTRKWRPPVSNLTFTAWQLTAGGILLLPVAYFLEPALPAPTTANILGMAYLGLIGAALTYFLWFRGLARIEPSAAASLGFLSPVVATLLGWLALGQSLTPAQIVGFVAVLFSIWLSQRSQLPR